MTVVVLMMVKTVVVVMSLFPQLFETLSICLHHLGSREGSLGMDSDIWALFLLLQPWACHIISLSLSFFSCKMGMVICTSQMVIKFKLNNLG